MPLYNGKGHEDDAWMPFTKPTDPCQVPGCEYEKHVFPFSRIAAGLNLAGKQTLDVSRWCSKHTAQKGFCLRCRTQRIRSTAIPFCEDCCKEIQLIARTERLDVTLVEYSREVFSRNRKATYVVRH